MDELGENLSSQLSSWPAQHHQLNPLGDPITKGNGTLQHGDVLHAAAFDVILKVYKLMKEAETEENKPLHGNCKAICARRKYFMVLN